MMSIMIIDECSIIVASIIICSQAEEAFYYMFIRESLFLLVAPGERWREQGGTTTGQLISCSRGWRCFYYNSDPIKAF
jgi:hypothetical protein